MAASARLPLLLLLLLLAFSSRLVIGNDDSSIAEQIVDVVQDMQNATSEAVQTAQTATADATSDAEDDAAGTKIIDTPTSTSESITPSPTSVQIAQASQDVQNCSCGFYDPSANATWTDAIILYMNETDTFPADMFVKEVFQHKWEQNINAVYRFGSNASNIRFTNASTENSNFSSVQITLEPPTSQHAVVGGSLRTTRRDILFGRFETLLKSPRPWAGGSALSMSIRYNTSQSLDINVMNSDKPDDAWTSFLLNGDYLGNHNFGVNFTQYNNTTYDYLESPWDFVPYRIEWNESTVKWFLGDKMVRNVTKKKQTPPLTPAPLYFQHWSLGDKYSTFGPPSEPSNAYVGLVRAFFNSSVMTKAEHKDFDKRCNHQVTCLVDDISLRGSTNYTATSLVKYKYHKPDYYARWPAIFLAAVSGGITTFLLIHTFFKRAPWRKVVVVGHGAPPAPPPPPPAPAPAPEKVEAVNEMRKRSVAAGLKPAQPKKSIIWSDMTGLLGAAATPGAQTPGNLTPGMMTPGAITPRSLTPPLPEVPKYSQYGYSQDKPRLPSFAEFHGRSQPKLYTNEDLYDRYYDEDMELDPLDPGRGHKHHSQYSLATTSTLDDGPEIRVTKPSISMPVKPRDSFDSLRYSKSSKGYRDDDEDHDPFGDNPAYRNSVGTHVKTREYDHEESDDKETEELHIEFENFDDRAHPVLVERAEKATHTKSPKRPRVDYLAGLVAMGCLVVSMAHVALTFLPAVEMESADAHYKSERFAYKFLTPFLLLFSWIGPFFTTSARFLVWNYLERGDLMNIAEKTVGRTPRLIIPCAAIAAIQYFAMQMGAISWLEMLPSITWSTWPYTAPFPNFGHYLSEVMELMYIIPNAVPVITFNYCTGVLWTIPVQLQNSWLTLLAVIVVYEIKTPWKRFGYYAFCIINSWYAVSWGAFFWVGLAVADLEITYNWKTWIYARPHVHYPLLLVSFCVMVGSQSTDLVTRFRAFDFDIVERDIHPDILTGKPIGQTAASGYPPYYMPRLSALTFAVGAQLLVELSPLLQRFLSNKIFMKIFPHVLSIYLIHGFIFWSWGAFVCVHLSAAGVPYWANMLITILTSYTLIFISLPLVTPVVDTLGLRISEEIWESASTKPAIRRRSMFPFPLELFEGAAENYGGNLRDRDKDVRREV